MNRLLFLGLGAVALAATVAVGYLVASGQAPDEKEAASERDASYAVAFDRAKLTASQRARARGTRSGTEAGKEEGSRAGTKAGRLAGTDDAEAELTARVSASAPAEAEDSADEELVPCWYGPRDLCTPQENAAEAAIEAECGPGDPSRIQPDGSYLPEPGC